MDPSTSSVFGLADDTVFVRTSTAAAVVRKLTICETCSGHWTSLILLGGRTCKMSDWLWIQPGQMNIFLEDKFELQAVQNLKLYKVVSNPRDTWALVTRLLYLRTRNSQKLLSWSMFEVMFRTQSFSKSCPMSSHVVSTSDNVWLWMEAGRLDSQRLLQFWEPIESPHEAVFVSWECFFLFKANQVQQKCCASEGFVELRCQKNVLPKI